MKKKVCCMLLLCALILTCMAGCSNGGESSSASVSSSSSSEASSSSSSSEASSSESSASSSAVSSEPQSDVASEPLAFSIMIDAPAEFNPDGNEWVEEVNKRTNCEITWIAYPTSNFEEKRNATMAAGSGYPDVIYMSGLTDPLYESMVNNSIILPLNDYFTAEITPNILEYTSDVTWDAVTQDDGSRYILPRCTIIRLDYMLIRSDWRDKLGLETPVTIDDWRTFFKACAEDDPDGNGVNDTYGLTDTSMLIVNGNNMDFFATAWHAGKTWYIGEDGNLFYGMYARDGRFKYVLEFYRNLYSDGSLDPDFISLKSTVDTQTRIEQGVVSSIRMFAGNLDRHLSVLRSLEPEADFELVDFPISDQSDQYANETPVSTNAGLYGGWSLTNTASGKEEGILRALDWFISDEGWNIVRNGVEGVHYQVVNGEIEYIDPAHTLFSQYAGYVQLLRRPNDPNLWLKNIIPEKYDYEKEWLEKSVAAMDEYQQSGLIGIVSENRVAFDKTEAITTTLPELCVEIVYGEKPLEAWDEFLDEIYANGWQDVLDEYNAYYQEHVK